MARRAKSSAPDEIEVVLGFQQVFGLVVFAALALGSAYVVGVESGHSRERRGQPSLLAFLEKEVDAHTDLVELPEVLLERFEEERAKLRGAGEGGKLADASRPGKSPERVKPTAAVTPGTTAKKAPPAKAAASKPASQAPAPAVRRQAPQGRRLHYQVAALKSRTNAKGLVDWLRAQGLPGYIRPAGDDGLYRVLVGPFGSDREAESAKVRLAQDGFAVMARKL